MSWRLPIAARLALATAVAALVALAPGWSNSTWASAPNHAAPAAKHGSLSGKWSGTYSGTSSGTFSLTWQQSGKNLSGTIMISSFKKPKSIHGIAQGTSIRFGTVGSDAITYSGSISVSGNSMSGSWQRQHDGRSVGHGSWKAARS
ncbi:MAG: hypothetical protein ACLP36_11600 [Acidimicrobiales bacterium]